MPNSPSSPLPIFQLTPQSSTVPPSSFARKNPWVCLLAGLPVLLAAPAARAEGVSLDALYVADVLHNSRGGLQTGTGYLDDMRLQLSVDAEETLGIPGGNFFAFARAINSSDFSARYSGEFQKVSNIDASPAVHLYEAWYDQAFLDDRLSIRAGLYDLNTEFDANPVAVLFMNAAHGIGTDYGQTGQNGPSIFPVTSLAARVAWQDPSGFSARFALLDGVPGDPAHPKRLAVKLGNGDGALLAAEAGYAWDAGQVALGAWHYTASFEDMVDAASGTTRNRKDNAGAYGFVTNRLYDSGDGGPAFDAYLRIGIAQPALNPVAAFLGVGLVGTGLIPGRPDDLMGVSIGTARTGSPYRRATVIGGGLATRHETEIEITYRAQISSWLTIQPDAQVLMNPSFDPSIKNAFIVGVRFEIAPLSLFQ